MNPIDIFKLKNSSEYPMTVEDARDPKYFSIKETSILLDVKFKGSKDYVSFTAMPTDPEPWGRELYADSLAGKYGEIKPYVPPEPPPPPAPPPKENDAKKR